MTTLDDALATQKSDSVLYAPTITGPQVVEELELNVTLATTLNVGLYNSTSSSNVYAYITGLTGSSFNTVFLLESDGKTPYYPSNPASNGTPLSANCAIALGGPGTTTNVTIPYIAGGRIWFCVGSTLTFLLNPGSSGPGLVEPSVSNTSDPNYALSWDFCEFTYNSSQIYANISYVDFVCLPIALTLTSTTGAVSHVGGLPSNGLATICNNLVAQNNIDGAGWDQLVIKLNGSILRALSPTNGIVFNSSLFGNYWTNYISSVWTKYISTPLTIDTQAQWGVVQGYTSNDRTSITFSGIGSFTKPAAADIFGAASGAFAAQGGPNNAELLNIGARLDAAFNRSTLLIDSDQPEDEAVSTYYTNSTTNHYARIVHAANVDGRGYCFPYDDVTPTGGADQSGYVADPTPANFLVTVGGGNAYARREERQKVVSGGGKKIMRRSVHWEEDVKEPALVEDSERDLEKGELEHPKLLNEDSRSAALTRVKLPPVLERLLSPYLTKLRASPFYINRLQPVLELISQFLISFLSLSLRMILSRVFIVICFFLFYFLGLLPHGQNGETQRRVLESVVVAAGSTNGTLVL